MRGRTGFEDRRQEVGSEGQVDPGGWKEGVRGVCTHAEGSGVEKEVEERWKDG